MNTISILNIDSNGILLDNDGVDYPYRYKNATITDIGQILGRDTLWQEVNRYEHPITIINDDLKLFIKNKKINKGTRSYWHSILSKDLDSVANYPWYKDPLASDFMFQNGEFWIEVNHRSNSLELSDRLLDQLDIDDVNISTEWFLSCSEGTQREDIASLLDGEDIDIDIEVRLKCSQEKFNWYKITLKPYEYVNGKLSRSVLFLKDIQNEKMDALNVYNNAQLISSVARSIPDVIVLYNPSIEKIVYTSYDELTHTGMSVFKLGKTAEKITSSIYSLDKANFIETFEECINTKNTKKLFSVDIRLSDKYNKDWKWYRVRLCYMVRHNLDKADDERLILGIVSDIDNEKKSQEQILEQGLLLDESQLANKSGGWKYDLATNSIKYTNGLKILFPQLKENYSGIEGFTELGVSDFYARLVSFLNSNDQYQSTEFSVENNSGLKWFKSRIKKIASHTSSEGYLIGSISDITTLKEKEEALRGYQEQLEEQVREKSAKLVQMYKEKNELYRTARHDINNPLTAILLRLELMQDLFQKNHDTEYLSKLDDITEAASRIYEILNRFTDQNNSVWKDYKVSAVRFHTDKVISEFIGMSTDTCTKKGILVDHKKNNCELFTDKFLYGQIFENILSNAIKYCSAGDRIDISQYADKETYILSVEDTGPGIPKSEIPKLFTDDTKYINKPTGGESSTGVGLYFSQKYADLLGGKIICESKVGKGSTFRLTIPKVFGSVEKRDV